MTSGQGKVPLIFIILGVAACLRIFGIWHDYPYSYYPDEVHFVKRALSFGSMDFNPHWFHKPAFFMYLLFFEYGIYFLIGKVVGLWASVSDFGVSYIINPGPFYVIGRVTVALFSIGTVWVGYLTGERHFKQGVGTVSALLLTFCYGHIAASQDIKADIPAAFFAIASLYFLLNYLDKHTLKDIIWASVMAGIGTATKKYPIVMLLPIVLSIIIINKDVLVNARLKIIKIIRYIGMVLAVFYLSYFICSPFNFIDPTGRRSTFGFITGLPMKIYNSFSGVEAKHVGDFIDRKTGILEGFINYFKVLVSTDGMGIVIGSMAIMGIVYLCINIHKKTIIFLLFPIAFVMISVFSFPGYAESRHQLPIYPFLTIAAGALIMTLAGNKVFWRRVVFIILLIGLMIPVSNIVERALYVTKQDTRNLAKIWIESNIPSGSKMLINENSPQLIMGGNILTENLKKASKADPSGQFTAHYDTYLEYQLFAAKNSVTYNFEEIRLPWWREKEKESGRYYTTSDYDKDMGNPLKPVGVMPFEYYRDNGYEYAVVDSYNFGSFMRNNSKKALVFPTINTFYHTLFKRGILIKEFDPEKLNIKGPVIKIFRFKE
jgi:4-amino-4-deoxy-L-arabinose transferase-like glycosyltransferase